ncbi:unnamed protein product [Kuraishia capsulata CBS 1993]|uniref:Iron-sulfur assembly protein 1 n=1 Tax=Kuraishia capsulata CBS 1993 TaxID=1382522 RepID=W6MVU4_9ASCO|nr:uncharacterized protein KUCA_T00002512001 [Kuraishia capsulata CBS 1993]CDK26540.1 unnamed protein product [Kuraishia capsulata CBS 1993]
MSIRLLSNARLLSSPLSLALRRCCKQGPSPIPVRFIQTLNARTQDIKRISDFDEGFADKEWSKHSLPTKNGRFVETAPAEKTTTQEEPKKRRRKLRPRKALITLSPNALHHLRKLSSQPNPKMIRIGVQNRGCSGLSYHLEYVTEQGQFDELIEQDGVKVLIDSKALFSIVGSEMDWIDDKLSSKFVFKNPNSKGTCGCGESFMV